MTVITNAERRLPVDNKTWGFFKKVVFSIKSRVCLGSGYNRLIMSLKNIRNIVILVSRYKIVPVNTCLMFCFVSCKCAWTNILKLFLHLVLSWVSFFIFFFGHFVSSSSITTRIILRVNYTCVAYDPGLVFVSPFLSAPFLFGSLVPKQN